MIDPELRRRLEEAIVGPAVYDTDQLLADTGTDRAVAEELDVDDELRAQSIELFVAGVERFVSYCWRRRLLGAISRELDIGRDGAQVSVAFVDLVDFTRTTRDLADDELAALVARFERRQDVVTSPRYRTMAANCCTRNRPRCVVDGPSLPGRADQDRNQDRLVWVRQAW